MAFECNDCELHVTKGKCYVKGKGNLKADIMVIGDCPSYVDSQKGYPFMGSHGSTLRAIIKDTGLKPEDMFFTNLIRCHPPDENKKTPGKPNQDQTEACWKHLQKEINYIKPKLIILLGALAKETLLRGRLAKSPISKLIGKPLDSGEFRTWMVDGRETGYEEKTFQILVTYAPGHGPVPRGCWG